MVVVPVLVPFGRVSNEKAKQKAVILPGLWLELEVCQVNGPSFLSAASSESTSESKPDTPDTRSVRDTTEDSTHITEPLNDEGGERLMTVPPSLTSLNVNHMMLTEIHGVFFPWKTLCMCAVRRHSLKWIISRAYQKLLTVSKQG